MDISDILGILFIILGAYFLLAMGFGGFFRREEEPTVWDWMFFPESTFVETVIKELFGETGLRVAYGIFGVVLILIGLLLL